MRDVDSQGGRLVSKQKRKRASDGRARIYAFLAYKDSTYPDFKRRLDEEHVSALISPLHDRDRNPDGTIKKEHWHIMVMFPGKKSLAQMNGLRERVIGPNYNPGFEEVSSVRGYARYMIHADNPEKVQYDRCDVTELGGADWDAITRLPGDDAKMLKEIMEYIRVNEVEYYSDFMLMCAENNPEWYTMLVSRKSYVVIEFIKSESCRRARIRYGNKYGMSALERDQLMVVLDTLRGAGLCLMDLQTGEVLGGKEDNYDSED